MSAPLKKFQPMMAPTMAWDAYTGGQRHDEGPGEGIDRAELAQGLRSAGAADDGSQHDEYRAAAGGRPEANHAASDGRAEDIGGVVGSQRPPQEKAA